MNKQLMLHKFIEDELMRYTELMEKFMEELPQLPSGSITKTKKDNYFRIHREHGVQVKRKLYQEDDELLNSLKKKRQIKTALPILSEKISLCRDFLQKDTLYDPCSIENSLPEQYRRLNSPFMLLPGDIDPNSWKMLFSVSNSFHPESLVHVSEAGLHTRSKSEAIIASQLERHNIEFKYEPMVNLGFRTVCPDFVIFLPDSRKIIYWEHLGLVDDAGYMMNALRKLDDYANAGYYLGFNLIITYETKDHPLTIMAVNKKIDELLNMSPF